MNITIRKATFLDIEAMTSLLYQLFSIEEAFTFNEIKQKRGLELLINSRKSAIVLIAGLDGKVIGMLTAQIFISTAEGKKAALLEDMVIDKKYRQMGIGKKLMEALGKWAMDQKISRLQLLADITNSPALSYYDKLGWKQTKMICLRKYI
jgi:ribosomal protein S18 acetylase RimI-like enzyme